MSQIKLYSYFRSTAAYRVRIALNFKNISYEQICIHLIKNGGEHRQADYLALNPQGRVPLLVDDDLKIIQSLAIIDYLEDKYPNPSLLPTDLSGRAFVRSIAQLISCDIHPLNNLGVLTYLSTELKSTDDQKQAWYHHWLKKGFDALEKLLQEAHSDNYCYGTSVSLADICLIPQVYNAKRFNFSLQKYPIIERINNHCLTLPFFMAATPDNQPDAE